MGPQDLLTASSQLLSESPMNELTVRCSACYNLVKAAPSISSLVHVMFVATSCSMSIIVCCNFARLNPRLPGWMKEHLQANLSCIESVSALHLPGRSLSGDSKAVLGVWMHLLNAFIFITADAKLWPWMSSSASLQVSLLVVYQISTSPHIWHISL